MLSCRPTTPAPKNDFNAPGIMLRMLMCMKAYVYSIAEPKYDTLCDSLVNICHTQIAEANENIQNLHTVAWEELTPTNVKYIDFLL